VGGQTTFACDLYRAVAEHFNGISALAGLAPEDATTVPSAWLLNA
jgi:hypothetical protein